MSKTKFKVGDKVRTYKGNGEIVYFHPQHNALVDLGEDFKGHDGYGIFHRKTCYWFFAEDSLLTPI